MNKSVRKELLGTAKISMSGLETEFFVRMNAFQPFVRFSRFKLPNSITIPGFSGTQVTFGVHVLSATFKKRCSDVAESAAEASVRVDIDVVIGED